MFKNHMIGIRVVIMSNKIYKINLRIVDRGDHQDVIQLHHCITRK